MRHNACSIWHRILSRRMARPFAVLIIIPVLIATSVSAGYWQGREVTESGVLHVMNSAHPVESPSTVKLEKLWEIGGDEEEEFFFGVIAQICSDAKGNIYLLDAQLSKVMIFSSDGEYIRSVGREGEGPGEFNRASDLFLTASGNVAVMQRMPGKIVLLSPDGEPLGNYPVPEPADRGVQMFSGAELAGNYIVLATDRFVRRNGGIASVSALIGVDETGNKTATYFTMEDMRDLASMEFDEKTMRFGAMIWSAGLDGCVYISDDFDAYYIKVLLPDGTIDRVIEREYESRLRSEEEMELARPRIMIRGGGRTRTPEMKMSKTDRDIQRIFPREDGSLWVLSSRGAFDAPEGAIAAFDVYDRSGKFTRQVTFEGKGNYRKDGFHFVNDRFYVVTGLRSARRAMFGDAGGGADSDEEAEPMSVICYDLSPILQSKK